MKNRTIRPLLVGICLVALMAVGLGALIGHRLVNALPPVADQPLNPQTVSVTQLRPLDTTPTNGKVVFTFDDGPDCWTPALLSEMRKLHVHGIFFVFGYKAAQYPQVIRAEVAAGDRVEDHSWDHPSFTGRSTDTAPLSNEKIRAELITTVNAITAAGAPAPTLYRAPFGDIDAQDNQVAASLGLRIVQPFATTAPSNVVDSRDWTGISARQIANTVIYGYWGRADHKAVHFPGLAQGARIVGFHDSGPASCGADMPLGRYPIRTIQALALIVDWMNKHHLGSTTEVPANATGGAVPNIIPKG
jgi:peptidoglycan/xylan/chitin deacetylase (PgdA/CDA1 family)